MHRFVWRRTWFFSSLTWERKSQVFLK
jgi:hypothetical protein